MRFQGRSFACSRRTISQRQKRRSPKIRPVRAPTALRYPEPGWPVRVVMRAQAPRSRRAAADGDGLLDPPTAMFWMSWISARRFSDSCMSFHENLTIPNYSGRQIVGWAGVGMLIMSLTGFGCGGRAAAIFCAACAGSVRHSSPSTCTIFSASGSLFRWQWSR